MSTHYVIDPPIDKAEFERKVEQNKDISIVTEDGESIYALFDGTNYVHVDVDDNNSVFGFMRYGGNDPSGIITELEDVFDIYIVDEYNDDYWEIMDALYPPEDEED